MPQNRNEQISIKTSILLAVLSMIPATIASFGWLTSTPALYRVSSEFPAMTVESIVCVFLLAVANMLAIRLVSTSEKTSGVLKRLLIFSVGFVITFAVLTLGFYRFYALGYFHEATVLRFLSSPRTLIAILFLGIAIVLGTFSKIYRNFALVLLVIPFYIAIVALNGYVLSYSGFYSTYPEIGMSIETAVSIILLVLSGLCGPLRLAFNGFFISAEPSGVIARFGLPVALFFPPICTWFVWAGYRFGFYPQEWALVFLVVIPCMVLTGVFVYLVFRLNKSERETKWQKKVKQSLQDEFTLYRDQESARAHFGAIIESTVDGVISQNLQGVITFWNDAATSMFGYSPEEVGSFSFADFMKSPDLANFTKAIAEAKDGKVVRDIEVECMSKSRELLSVALSVSPIRNDEGEVYEVSILVRNISQLKKELEHRKKLAEELRQANIAKDQFLANLSHEMRTPLNAIIGFSDLLPEMVPGSDEYAEAVETIRRNAYSELTIVESVLDISSIVSGTMTLDPRPFSLRRLIECLIETHRFSFAAKELDLKIDIEDAVASFVGDEKRISQVIWNLLSNAIKFTEKGKQICLSARKKAEYYEITVSDLGIGIAGDMMPHIFRRFWQVDGTNTRAYEGLGVGLSIAQYIAEAHGGKIFVSSGGLGKGATFVLQLPFPV